MEEEIPILSPEGCVWTELRASLHDAAVKRIVKRGSAPFLVELPEGVLDPPPSRDRGIEGRLQALRESPELREARIHFLDLEGRPRQVLGRKAEFADLVIPEPTSSKRHALVAVTGGVWRITDLEAANGTYLEGSRLPAGIATPIPPGTILGISKYRCMVLSRENLKNLVGRSGKQHALASPPEGHRLRDLVAVLGGMMKEHFLSQCESGFMVQVPVESPVVEEELDTAEDLTQAISRTRIMKLKRSRDVGSARVFVLNPPEEDEKGLGVGRSFQDAEIVLDEKTVSKRHAEFYYQGGRWQLMDLGSQNGTFVEGDRLPANVLFPLRAGLTVLFSSYRILFLSPEQLYGMAEQIADKRSSRRRKKGKG